MNLVMKDNPIIIIEDDEDDKYILNSVLDELEVSNPIIWFTNGDDAIEYLATTEDVIFLILCDVNLPGHNGMYLKRAIDSNEELREKSIPFVFYSTAVLQEYVDEAYNEFTVQGFFQKDNDYNSIKEVISVILKYWEHSYHPNTFNVTGNSYRY